MNCPACKDPMLVLEYEEVEVDYCVSCHGIWLDAGELELLFGDRAITEGFMTAGCPSHAKGEQVLRCPECRRKMKKETTGGEPPVVYDHCPNNDGVWFDQGELATVLKNGSSAQGGDQVAHWLHEMFLAEDEEAMPPDEDVEAKPSTGEA